MTGFEQKSHMEKPAKFNRVLGIRESIHLGNLLGRVIYRTAMLSTEGNTLHTWIR